jgi:DNA excision repair protein ERCC-4
MLISFDTREPWPHPWERHLPSGWSCTRENLETGDVCVSNLPLGTLVERKTVPDLLGCIGNNRERFERELKRSRYAGRMLIVCEGDLDDVLIQARGLTPAAITGTLAAWAVRYAPVIFAGSVERAAEFTFRALAEQVRTAERQAKALQRKPKTL